MNGVSTLFLGGSRHYAGAVNSFAYEVGITNGAALLMDGTTDALDTSVWHWRMRPHSLRPIQEPMSGDFQAPRSRTLLVNYFQPLPWLRSASSPTPTLLGEQIPPDPDRTNPSVSLPEVTSPKTLPSRLLLLLGSSLALVARTVSSGTSTADRWPPRRLGPEEALCWPLAAPWRPLWRRLGLPRHSGPLATHLPGALRRPRRSATLSRSRSSRLHQRLRERSRAERSPCRP
jgi:hypothetical protein